ncbi:Lrp/AsnC family transcriptional regulator [Homoserinimonas sp. A447]
MMPNELDEALFNALHDNGRMSLSALSRTIGAPRHRVQQRLHELLSSGSISIVANVHPALLGIHTYCHLLIRVDGDSSRVADALRALHEVPLVSLISGEFDIAAEVGAHDVEHLSRTISTIRELPGVRLVEASQHSQIFKSRFDTITEVESAPVLDRLDLRLVALLQQDGRMPYRAIGAQLQLSAASARARVQKLLANGSLRITCVVKRSEAARSVLMGVGISVTGAIESIEFALREHEQVEFVASTIGKFDLIATLSAPSLRGLRSALDDIRRNPAVARAVSWIHLEVVRESYEIDAITTEWESQGPI